MYSEAKKYFKYLNLVQEDIKEEFDLLGISLKKVKICDFGCGTGITTFALALESEGAECIGIDLFNNPPSHTPDTLNKYIEIVRDRCENTKSSRKPFSADLCKLITKNRHPRFSRGNILMNHNLPKNIDFAYCKKLLFNLTERKSKDAISQEESLITGLTHISQCVRSDGLICLIEYDKEYILEKYLDMSKLRIVKRTQFNRREIRSRGRTNVVSMFTLYLCQKSI